MNPELRNIEDSHDDLLGCNIDQVMIAGETFAGLIEVYAYSSSVENELEVLKACQELNGLFDDTAKTIAQTDFSSLEKIAMARTISVDESQKTVRKFNKVLGTKLLSPANFVISCSQENLDEIEDTELLKIISDYFRRERNENLDDFITHVRSTNLPRYN